ncbi:hypothetical protein F5X99DRAFT_158943 [Biscogniauxia marginata]|nr:hypothetical protein F5X99DRAFT_158943 [Biscogniauxia marginata]
MITAYHPNPPGYEHAIIQAPASSTPPRQLRPPANAVMDRRRLRKPHIEIPIPFKPRPYRPGDGPALAPLRLALQNDSDAFIIDRRVRPGTPINGEIKLEMYYVVGWPDLPAARVSVLATKIYDYVSPRTLEEWEYNYALEKDKEKERQETAARKAAKAKLHNTSSISTPKSGTPGVPAKKKRGRPGKADKLARALAQQTGFEDANSVEVSLPPASISGPSLSTPQKRLAAEIATDAEDQDEEDVGNAIYKQLCGGDTEMGIDDPGEAADPSPGSLVAQYAQRFMSSTNSTRDKQTNGSHSRKISTTPVPVPVYPRPKKKASSSPKPKLITPVPIPAIPNPSPKKPMARETPVPVPLPSHSQLLNNNGSQSTPRPRLPSTLPHYGFTPAGRSSGRWLSGSETSTSRDYITEKTPVDSNLEAAADNATPARSHKKKKKSRPAPDDGEPVYVVKRLEDDQLMEIDGKEERFFKVRWEGDWPADQNPTWEPENNIPKSLVKKYLRSKARKGDGEAAESPKKGGNRPTPTLKRKYSSVAEAFEGDAEEEPVLRGGSLARDSWADGDKDEGEERLLVTEQRSGPATPLGKRQFNIALTREIASSFQHGGQRSGSSAS